MDEKIEPQSEPSNAEHAAPERASAQAGRARWEAAVHRAAFRNRAALADAIEALAGYIGEIRSAEHLDPETVGMLAELRESINSVVSPGSWPDPEPQQRASPPAAPADDPWLPDVANLAAMMGVPLDKLAAPGSLDEPYNLRRARHKERWPHLLRTVQVALRAIELARRISVADPKGDGWNALVEQSTRLYEAGVLHGHKLDAGGARVVVMRKLESAADWAVYGETCRAMARRKLGEKLTAHEKRLLARTEDPRYQQALQQIGSAPPDEWLRKHAAASIRQIHQEAADTLRWMLKDVMPQTSDAPSDDVLQRAVREWRGRGEKWVAAQELMRKLGLPVDNEDTLKVEWSKWRRSSKERAAARNVMPRR